ncbi:non-ribosomal peptide synthetase [Streptomyces boncukensis]|uniref:Amino acid adenylation domain-containing protein n=1 Tax=Streptomyces boncukensis TaxID=2711219 RepID=A0A6G4X2E5_9ACTN|nr:non-ribosomal peptide synthetase [Streptomyces boncukensis]NGO71716.1 amino acid adenylation domain-containing protein [Streptomyces boncukensis]
MFGLSPSQEIVWLHEQLLPGSRAYNFTATVDLWGDLDEDALRGALGHALQRHPGLRLELVARDGALPRQRVNDRCAPRIRALDLTAEADPERAFEAALRTEATTPLDTAEAPLLRWCLARLGARHHRLIHVEHHLVHDGRSFALLLHDVFATYRARVLGEPLELPEAPSYERYARAAADPRRRAAGLAYWERELRDAAFDAPLPGLARPGAVRRHAGGQLRQAIGADLAERLRDRSRRAGHTPFSTLLTLFTELLRRHSGRGDLVVGTAVGNRPEGYEDTVGMFVNTIPLRLRPDPAAPAAEAVDEATDGLIRALPHQDVPVQELTRALGLHTGGADNPLFSVMFSAHDAPLPEIDVPGLEVALHEGFNTGTTRFDLDLVLIPDDRRVVGPRGGPAGMTLVWDYDRDMFAEDSVRLLAGRFLDLLRGYLDAPERPLAALASGAGQQPVPEPRAADADPDAALDPLARHDAARPALLSGSRQLSYGELRRQVDELAGRLRAAGVTAGQPVAAVLPRGEHSLVTLLACLRTRAVYCPLSPHDPRGRLEKLLRRLNPALVLATRESALALPAEGLPLDLLDGPAGAPLPSAAPEGGAADGGAAHPGAADAGAADPGAPGALEGVAYVIHTSGSTGLPKPVAVSRAALAGFVSAVAERYALSSADRVLLFAQPSFDVALEEALPSLLAGACLVAPQREVPTGAELAAVLAARRVTVGNLPTSYLRAVSGELAEALSDGRWSPRLLVLGGERLPAAALRGLLDACAAAGTTVLNAYGLTEATVTSTVHRVETAELADAAEVPLGTELPGTRIHVLDTGLRPLPAGAVGELAVTGAALADGYLGNPEATAARFPAVDALGGARAYLTGDLGYRDLAGRVCFLGRRDHQVKLRGYRVELEEIETVAAAVSGVPCAVVHEPDAEGGPRLTGFLETGEAPDPAALHRDLAGRLPLALVPARWVPLPALPTLPGGKPDRTALARTAAELPGAGAAGADAAGAGGGAGAGREDAFRDAGRGVARLAEGWRAVLGHDAFAPDSHFFQVGGHSLLAAQLAAWLEEHTGHRPPLRLLFRHPHLADQAAALEEPTA